VKGRHLLPFRRKGDFRDAWHLGPYRVRIEARADRGHDERTLRRVAHDDPSILVLLQFRIVAQHAAFEQSTEIRVGREVHLLAIGPYIAGRIESLAAHLVLPRAGDEQPDVHLPLRQSSGLVGADDGRRAEGLHGG